MQTRTWSAATDYDAHDHWGTTWNEADPFRIGRIDRAPLRQTVKGVHPCSRHSPYYRQRHYRSRYRPGAHVRMLVPPAPWISLSASSGRGLLHDRWRSHWSTGPVTTALRAASVHSSTVGTAVGKMERCAYSHGFRTGRRIRRTHTSARGLLRDSATEQFR